MVPAAPNQAEPDDAHNQSVLELPQCRTFAAREFFETRHGLCRVRKLSLKQPADRLGQQHLLPMARGQQAGKAVETGREVIVIIWLGNPGVQCHTHPERTSCFWPGLGLQCTLPGHRRSERWRGGK
ncbi:MAG TPA: hypothetical protein VKA61_02600, partial [Sphingomicrobium sp.]|nr:hypothetical protein [Sphingomicrobium sp.]